jgi:toxin ParE1/3/4
MRRYAVVLTPRAQRQLDALYATIAADAGEPRADHYVGGIIEACLSLANFPERGTKRNDIRANLRTMGYARRVTIAFSVDAVAKTVAVHGVFYGGQDFERSLGDD